MGSSFDYGDYYHLIPASGPLYTAPERLLNRSDAALQSGANLFSFTAPVGYGKSSFAAAVARRTGPRTLWLTLSEELTDAERLERDLYWSLHSGGWPVEDVENDPGLILSKAPPSAVCIDNLHLLGPSGSEYLARFLSYLPKTSLRIVCADEDHPLPLSRFRLEESLFELRSDDFSARLGEVLRLFEKSECGISEEDAGMLIRKTGGWWACIRLFVLAWRELDRIEQQRLLSGFKAKHTYVSKFISEEIDRRLSPAEREFMRQVSVCPAIHPSLGRELSERTPEETDELISSLRKRLLLIPHGNTWLRLPRMLREYYLGTMGREAKQTQHALAAAWFESVRLPDRARYHRSRSGISPLQKRETEILSLAARGLSNQEIGEKLFISTGTVKWHMNRILEKIDCPNRTAAAEWARRRGYLT